MENTTPFIRQYTIQQLSEKLNIPKPTLRFWEKELEGIIEPIRTAGGQRRYTDTHISVIEEIRDMRNSGLSISEIKERQISQDNSTFYTDTNPDIDLLTEKITEAVRLEVTKFFRAK